MGEETQKTGRARGGVARARQLSAEERKVIAKKAAEARWNSQLTEAVSGSSDRPLRIGEVEIECYVLDDGTRVLTQASFLRALGRHPKANVRREGDVVPIPAILQSKALSSFITDDILQMARPITFRLPNGGRAHGYDAAVLPVVCELYLKARESGALDRQQEHVAKRAEILVRGLAHVGIIALVDEATGYQEYRARDALSKILEAFIEKELQPWVRTFPAEFYRQLFRLRGLDYPHDSPKRPQYFGKLTNDIVYKRLAPGVLDALKEVTPRNEQGRPKHKYFQHLTSNIGYPKLREHLGSVVTLMRLSRDWEDFVMKLDQIHPRVGDAATLPFDMGGGQGL
ncbi:P63C domain-containing protein [Micromonospora chalcea]